MDGPLPGLRVRLCGAVYPSRVVRCGSDRSGHARLPSMSLRCRLSQPSGPVWQRQVWSRWAAVYVSAVPSIPAEWSGVAAKGLVTLGRRLCLCGAVYPSRVVRCGGERSGHAGPPSMSLRCRLSQPSGPVWQRQVWSRWAAVYVSAVPSIPAEWSGVAATGLVTLGRRLCLCGAVYPSRVVRCGSDRSGHAGPPSMSLRCRLSQPSGPVWRRKVWSRWAAVYVSAVPSIPAEWSGVAAKGLVTLDRRLCLCGAVYPSRVVRCGSDRSGHAGPPSMSLRCRLSQRVVRCGSGRSGHAGPPSMSLRCRLSQPSGPVWQRQVWSRWAAVYVVSIPSIPAEWSGVAATGLVTLGRRLCGQHPSVT